MQKNWFLGTLAAATLAACSPARAPDAAPPPRPMATPPAAAAAAEWRPAEAALMTRWAADVDPESPLPEYPRPQMVRSEWLNLNGIWEFAVAEEGDAAPLGRRLPRGILVPFPVQSALSGIGEHADRVWYRRTFQVPDGWSQRVLLHFGGVDWESDVYVNGQHVGEHRGGYDAFSFDITDALRPGGEQELVVGVYDPTDRGGQARGKQVEEPRGIWYTPVTGIWQTVWLEPVPATRIERLVLTPDLQAEALRLKVDGAGAESGDRVVAVASANGREVGRVEGVPGVELRLPVPDARLWSPDDPHLYDLRVALRRDGREVDAVESYFGMRSIAVARDAEGTPRIVLNGQPVFQVGPLDQGWWPDGLYTAPTDEALRYDLEITKRLGFNMTRKHVKVEPARWYYWADRLGVPVWQDMPNADNDSPEARRQFELELREMVEQFRNHPSILMWIPFNEGWGQYDTRRIARMVQDLDPARPVIDASGWQHMGAGDVIDVHRYRGPQAVPPVGERASVVGEFGGLGMMVPGHAWAGEGWGYQGTLESSEALATEYDRLLTELWDLRDVPGMTAGVYTQLTDVEREVNGLLTYDRAVLKMDTTRVAATNRGFTPLVRPLYREFTDRVLVEITAGNPAGEIRYTLDGSAPTGRSPRYTRPVALDRTTTVRARMFEDGAPLGGETMASFEKTRGQPPVEVAGVVPGIAYEYFESRVEDAPFRRHWPLRRELNTREGNSNLEPLRTGTLPTVSLEPRESDELFGFRYHGYIRVPETGVYTISTRSDDAARIWVGETVVIEAFGQSPATATNAGSVALRAGLHPIMINYFQAYGPSELEVSIEGPGLERQPLPRSMLFHAPGGARPGG